MRFITDQPEARTAETSNSARASEPAARSTRTLAAGPANERELHARSSDPDRELAEVKLERAFGPLLAAGPAASASPRVQRATTTADGLTDDPESIHEAGQLGIRGAGGPLPYLDQIQRAFGRHDVSGVVAHTDEPATAGARAMGAAAFTMGDHVAFADKPSLRTAAHEAAHAIQQRAGVELAGGVGQVGDVYERHADAVADLVVQGRSSEALLDAGPAGARAELEERQRPGGVQRQTSDAGAPSATPGPSGAKAPGVKQTAAAAASLGPGPGLFTTGVKQEWLATILAEAAPGNTMQEETFTWVYYNLLRKYGVKGLDRSTAHKQQVPRYLIYLYQAGDTSPAVAGAAVPKTAPGEAMFSEFRGHKTVAEVCADPDSYFNLDSVAARGPRVAALIEQILAGGAENPVEDCYNQGNLDDLNSISNPTDPTWRKARHYFFLQQTQQVTEEHVHFFPAEPPAHSQFVFNLDKINGYLAKNKIDISKTEVLFVDVQDREAIFRKTKEDLLYRKPKVKAKAAPPAQKLAVERARAEPAARPLLQRQPAGEARQADKPAAAPAPSAPAPAAAPRGVRVQTVMKIAEQLTGLPYAFSGSTTVKELEAKIEQLAAEIKALGQAPPRDATPEDKQKRAAALAAAQRALAEASTALSEAKTKYADESIIQVLEQKTGAIPDALKEAIRHYGVVCNIYVELTMRKAGFADFPVTEQAYPPQTEAYKRIEEQRIEELRTKGKRGTPGWELGWQERIADWVAAHGEVLYDDADPAKQTLPLPPKAGDIVIFKQLRRERWHVNLVVQDGAAFNLIGARNPKAVSGRSISGGFKSYDEKLPTTMQQEKYLWILRPSYAAAEVAAAAPESP